HEVGSGGHSARHPAEQGHRAEDAAEPRLGERLQSPRDSRCRGRVLYALRLVAATRGLGAADVALVDHRGTERRVVAPRADLTASSARALCSATDIFLTVLLPVEDLMSTIRQAVIAALIVPAALLSQSATRRAGASAVPKVGPEHGTVIVVGGGSMGPEIYKRFIAAAGGPDALIIDVPNAGGGDSYPQNGPSTRGWKQAGVKNIYVLFTKDRKLADTDSFVAILKTAGGIWFEGGRQFHLVDDYGGTKTEQAFNDVLARGGVVGGSSAGASILGDFLVRGAPSNNNFIMDHPGYEKGFAYLRGVGIDQHVVARERLADLADSIMPKFPALLAISEDEGTAWVVKGDTATIVGRNKAFVYGGKDATDAGKPFLTLHPGDKYNLGTRHVMHRAVEDSPVTEQFVSSLFEKYANPPAGAATVLVARNGEVLIDQSYGVPAQPKY